MQKLPLEEVLLVMLGGLFGWTLGKIPQHWVYVMIGIAILLALVVGVPAQR